TSSSAFETASDCDVVAFDKTGTLTTGEMTVVEPATDEAMEYASAVEQYSEHPVADAVVEHTPPHDADVSDFAQHPGKGVSATVDGRRVVVGSPELFDEIGYEVPESHIERADSARSDANVPVLVGWDGRVRSTAVVGDEPRDSWKEVVSAVSDGREVAVITGDDERAAEKFREHPGIDRVFAGIPPEAKSEALQRLRSEGRVAMVGDGTNDVPALANADLGIGLGGGTAVAADAADVVIVEDRLEELPNVFGMMESTRRRIRQNLGWALVYNAVAIPMAVAGFINPLVAALAMATSSFLVVTNSARPIRTGSDTPKVSDWWTRFSERILRRKSAEGS
ncbi:MAG: HAD-IC family P-type ATPase, partial [Halobacteria archaeon]|nr:HAD-IC family P-type ATPase [Halobacteria archaeon]